MVTLVLAEDMEPPDKDGHVGCTATLIFASESVFPDANEGGNVNDVPVTE
jgi:hypothetical protein